MQPFREVKVWEKSHLVGLHIYRVTAGFPKTEQSGLISQMRKSAVAVPCKIAEGCSRNAPRELARYLESAKGSANELEYQVLLAKELGFLPEEAHGTLTEEITEVQKMLAGFIKTVRGKIPARKTQTA
jgi:four helix bundle protein